MQSARLTYLSAVTMSPQESIMSPQMNQQRSKITVIIPSNDSISSFKTKPFYSPVTWNEVMGQVAEKLSWEKLNNPEYAEDGSNTLENLSMNIFTIDKVLEMYQQQGEKDKDNLDFGSDVVLLVGLTESTSPEVLSKEALKKFAANSKAVVPLECSGVLFNELEKYGDYTPLDPLEPVLQIYDGLIKGRRFKDRSLQDITADLWERKSSGDILFMALVLIDAFSDISIKSVKSVTNTESTSFSQLSCMVGNCRKEIVDCLSDPECKAALDCLNNCKGNDQVCSYRCITSHETVKFEKFALCILQKNNCMGNTAVAPVYPDPQPMTMFRGQPLTHEAAEGIFVGHLEPRENENNLLLEPAAEMVPWSWKVVCGQNPAYDYFSNQHQIFYFDKRSKSTMWYDPVFKVVTLKGVPVWRRRHYRVKRAEEPGTFYFSVLDNGVTSKEYWRILDCADDLSWAVFYYTGAAAAAGSSYSGALVVTKDGSWPLMSENGDSESALTAARISKAVGIGGIKMWELFEVTNTVAADDAGSPPLGIN